MPGVSSVPLAATLRCGSRVTYLGIGELDPSKTYEISYRLVGAEDPLKDTIDIVGDEYEVAEHYVSTLSGDSKVRAIVLGVSEF